MWEDFVWNGVVKRSAEIIPWFLYFVCIFRIISYYIRNFKNSFYVCKFLEFSKSIYFLDLTGIKLTLWLEVDFWSVTMLISGNREMLRGNLYTSRLMCSREHLIVSKFSQCIFLVFLMVTVVLTCLKKIFVRYWKSANK